MKKYKFKGKVEAASGGGAYVLFPFDVEREFGTNGKVPVKAAFNGVPYSGSLVKYGNPLHMLPMLKAIREQTGTMPGDTVEVEVWKDEAPRTIEPPPELKQAMMKAGIDQDASPKAPPQGAVVLFNGQDLSGWVSRDGEPRAVVKNRAGGCAARLGRGRHRGS